MVYTFVEDERIIKIENDNQLIEDNKIINAEIYNPNIKDDNATNYIIINVKLNKASSKDKEIGKKIKKKIYFNFI